MFLRIVYFEGAWIFICGLNIYTHTYVYIYILIYIYVYIYMHTHTHIKARTTRMEASWTTLSAVASPFARYRRSSFEA